MELKGFAIYSYVRIVQRNYEFELHRDFELAQMTITRRAFLLGAGGATVASLAGCASSTQTVVYQERRVVRDTYDAAYDPDAAMLYAAKPDEDFPLPAIPYQKIKPQYYRQMVDNPTGEAPGTLVVDTGHHFLYLTYPNGKAMRYGVGLGRAGFAWSGRGVIQWKRKWPRWVPPDEMIARQPELAEFQAETGGKPPGLDNPLGARALYIFQNGEDTLYRIHGSPEWWTIGKSVSSGCVRMINQDVADLYDRVPNKTPIVVTDLSNPAVSRYDESPSSWDDDPLPVEEDIQPAWDSG